MNSRPGLDWRQNHLFYNNLVSVWESKYSPNTDGIVMLLSQLINVVSLEPGILDSINEKLGNIFCKRLGTKFLIRPSLPEDW